MSYKDCSKWAVLSIAAVLQHIPLMLFIFVTSSEGHSWQIGPNGPLNIILMELMLLLSNPLKKVQTYTYFNNLFLNIKYSSRSVNTQGIKNSE